jgi:NAD(P)-dependent dehydrogenase (short-subunit alcohol dehydrogenase family)
MRELKNKVAVVTGGAGGIGRATGALLAQRGAKVVLADIEQGALDQTVKELTTNGDVDVTGVVTDVTKFDSMASMRDAVLARHGKINIAFLNAGVAGFGRGAMWELDLKDWEWGLAVNVWGVIHGVKALLPPIVESGEEGHVVITSSSVGVVAPTPNGGIYNMTKAAGANMAESLYGQLRNMNVPVSASVLVPPGTINTGLFSSNRNRQAEYAPSVPREPAPTLTYDEMLRRMNASGNPRRPVQPEEVAEYVVDGIVNDTFWIMPGERHADIRDNFDAIVRARSDSILNRTDPITYMQKAT